MTTCYNEKMKPTLSVSQLMCLVSSIDKNLTDGFLYSRSEELFSCKMLDNFSFFSEIKFRLSNAKIICLTKLPHI